MEIPWKIVRKGDRNFESRPSELPRGEGELRHDLAVTRTIVIIGFVLGLATLAGLWFRGEVAEGFIILFWALACYASGSLLGFLFGIPRVLQRHAADGDSQFERDVKAAFHAPYQLLINTNLDDISDWLTKIVVGVSLVEIREIPSSMYILASMIAGEKGKADIPLVIAVILYFSVIGFISGYLTTRMFFQRAFRASDLAAGGVAERIDERSAMTGGETRLASGPNMDR